MATTDPTSAERWAALDNHTDNCSVCIDYQRNSGVDGPCYCSVGHKLFHQSFYSAFWHSLMIGIPRDGVNAS